MEISIDDIRAWYSDNILKLDVYKTEMMVFSSQFHPSVRQDCIKLGEFWRYPSETVHKMGVTMDST